MTDHSAALSAWESFYVIVGSSGGALIGLQFVVITLIAEKRHYTTPASLSAFGTPTVVHLAGALLVSALMSVPWPSLVPLSVAVGTCGAAGIAYGAIVLRRARLQTTYRPVLEDWLYYTALPWTCYVALAVAGVLLHSNARLALFLVGAAALGLLFVGIHNAWDTVTHVVLTASGSDRKVDE